MQLSPFENGFSINRRMKLIGEILVQMFRISLNAEMFRNNALSNFDNLCS